jgi:NADPH:quinone reductase-like Zn-dependent oxidoreductase
MVSAVVLSDYGPPEVLVPGETTVGSPGPGQIRVTAGFAGVGPTDLAIRAGILKGAFGAHPGSVLGFEAAGTVDAVGPDLAGVQPGDRVAVFLPELGGYAGQVLARYWATVPEQVSAEDAAALPASGEAAARVVDEVGVSPGETVLVVGAAGSVGLIACQLAIARGARVLAAVRPQDSGPVEAVGARPVTLEQAGPVDAVIDAAGAGILPTAVALAGGPKRVVTLSDPTAAKFGVKLSEPDGSRAAARLQTVMDLLAAGQLKLRAHTVLPLADAARAHRALESHELRAKVLLATGG